MQSSICQPTSTVDVAVVTETHFKTTHADSAVSIPDCTLLRRDRARRIGDVALYACTPWTTSADDGTFDLLSARVNGTFFGALYHLRRTIYTVRLYRDLC